LLALAGRYAVPAIYFAREFVTATTAVPEMLRRDLGHKGLLSESVTMDWRLLAWVELV
jgi:hypothetical protein